MDHAELRRFSVRDIIALSALTAVLAAFYHYGWIDASPLTRFVPPGPLDGNIIVDGLNKVRRVLDTAMPAFLGLAVLGFVRVLRERRETRRLLLLQPGVAACAALVAALCAAAANAALWLVRWIEHQEQWSSTSFPLAVFRCAEGHGGHCVIAVWAFLALGGLWASGRNWVNRLGGTLGVLVVLKTVLWCLP